MVQISSTLSSSVQAIPLSRGLHLFSITSATPQRIGDSGEMIVPAIHIGLGPGVSTDGVEILPGPRNNGHWLFEAGDTLVVWRLDRLGRSLLHLIYTVRDLQERGVGFRSLQEQIDTTTSGGKLVFHVFGALAEEPANIMTPLVAAERAQAMAREVGLDCEVLDDKKLKELGMNSMLSVALGSQADLPRVMTFLCTGRLPDGSTRAPHDYGVAITLLAELPRLVPADQIDLTREAGGKFVVVHLGDQMVNFHREEMWTRADFTLRAGMIYSVSPTVVANDREDRIVCGTSLVVTPDGYRELGNRKMELLIAGS